MHETDYDITTADHERAMIIDYLKAESDRLREVNRNVEAVVLLALIQDIQLGVHTQLPK